MRRYAIFDFWSEKFLGTFEGGIDVRVGSHDTSVLAIHPEEDHPQLLGTARHISGAFSIDAQGWDQTSNRLFGQSKTIPGAPYKLWIRVPPGFSVGHAKAESGHREIPAQMTHTGELLSVIVPGQQDSVTWEITFSR
jgi:hypothetical protein